MSNFYSLSKTYEKLIKEQAEEEQDEQAEEYVYRLSNDICDEFTKTVNSFTSTCARIVKKKGVTPELLERFQNSYSKIKNLMDAAKNTNLKKRTIELF